MWTEFNKNIIFISDMHILGENPICRTDNLVEEQDNKLEFIINFANENKAIILNSGDQTDTPRNFISFYKLSSHLKNLKEKMYCCLGQHDKYMRTKNESSTNLLIKLDQMTKLSKDPIKIENFFLYGCDFEDEVPEPTTNNNILVIHDSITTKELAIKNVEFKEAEEFLEKHKKYDIIICGDIHRRFFIEKNKRVIMNSGPILRKDASNYFLDYAPSFFFYNKDKGDISLIEIPHKKNVISRTHLELKEKRERNIIFDIGESKKNIDKLILNKIKKEKSWKELKKIIFD